jgi:hypothetical protein
MMMGGRFGNTLVYAVVFGRCCRRLVVEQELQIYCLYLCGLGLVDLDIVVFVFFFFSLRGQQIAICVRIRVFPCRYSQ